MGKEKLSPEDVIERIEAHILHRAKQQGEILEIEPVTELSEVSVYAGIDVYEMKRGVRTFRATIYTRDNFGRLEHAKFHKKRASNERQWLNADVMLWRWFSADDFPSQFSITDGMNQT